MFRNLLDNAPAAVLVSRLSDGEVLYANHELAAMVGLSLDRLIGKLTPDFYFDPSDREHVREALRTKGKVENFELHLKRTNGTPFWVETSFEAITFEGEPAIFAGYTDITERKRADATLREAETRYRRLSDITVEGIVVMESGRIVDVNRAATEMFRYTEQELIGRDVMEIVAPDAREFIREKIAQDFEGRYESMVLRRDGTTVPVEVNARMANEDGRRYRVVCARDITEIRKSQAALRESEERYALAAKAANDGLWDWNIRANEGYFSPRWKEILGYADHELERQQGTFTGMLHPDDFDRTMRAVRDHLEKRVPYDLEYRLRRKRGDYIWVRVKGQAVWDENGKPLRMAGSISDITERKSDQEALRESEELFRRLFDDTGVGTLIIGMDGKFQNVNRAYCDMLGYSEDELIGNSFAPITHPDDRDIGREVLREMAAGKIQTYRNEKRYLHKNGQIVWASVSGSVIRDADGNALHSVAHVQDITERKQAEEAAKESEEKYRSLVELSPDAVFVQQDGKIVFANSSAVRLYGADEPEQLVGRETISLVHPDDRHILLEWREVLKGTEEKQIVGALRRLRLDGSTFFGESVVSLIPWKGTQATMIVIRDHTERQAIEAQLRQAQKMEAVGQLTGGVAHDFNNLLTVVLGNLELLWDETEVHEVQNRFVESAIRATERGAMLTERLLAFSRKQTLHPRGLDLNELVAGLSDMLRRTLGETIEIEAKAADSLWPVFADPAQMESALLNLALNARDAMPNGGTLTIEAANIGIDDDIDDDYVAAHADVELGEYVLLSVSDTGTGMTREAVRRAFEPFFTTKEVGEGSGLGLSMVYGFAKQSGGHVSIHSEEGHGTTMKLYLPRAKQTDRQAEPDVATGVSAARAETILVVEDDPDVRTLTVVLLSDLGYEVLQADDGGSAIAAMKSRSRIDLLFTDVVLAGGMSGPEIADEAKRLHPAIGILFMSGYPHEAMVRRGQLGKSADMLDKPFRKADLARKIRGALCEAAPVAANSSA